MNPEIIELYKELKPYLIMDNEKYCYVLKDDVPLEIKEKYEKYLNLEDDEIVLDDNTTL